MFIVTESLSSKVFSLQFFLMSSSKRHQLGSLGSAVATEASSEDLQRPSPKDFALCAFLSHYLFMRLKGENG